MTALQRSVRITKHPQHPGAEMQATHSRVVSAVNERLGVVLLGTVERDRFPQVHTRHNFPAEHDQTRAGRVMRLQEERCVSKSSRQTEELLADLSSRLPLRLPKMAEP